MHFEMVVIMILFHNDLFANMHVCNRHVQALEPIKKDRKTANYTE